MKTLNNYVSVGSIVCDALVAGQRVEVLNMGTGRKFSTAYSIKDEGLTRRYQSGYQLDMLVKDMKITNEVIESVGFDIKLSIDADHAECFKGWKHRAGIELRKSEQSTNGVVVKEHWKP